MEKKFAFLMEDAVEIPDWATAYPENKFAVYRCCFLSTRENSHHIPITEEVLKKCAKSILGTVLVAEITMGDATTHTAREIQYGYFPIEQEIEFETDDDGVTKAYAYAVVTKRYSKEYNELFEIENFRNSSVEMTVTYADENETEVESFDVYALTTLGKMVKGSCPDANVKLVRFSQKKAEAFFKKNDPLTALKQFAAKTTAQYVEHPINTSKDAVYEGDWDGEKAKEDLIKEKNYSKIAPKVCLKLEDGWEDREITKLGYPVMGLYDGEWRYSKKALASALGYAKTNGEDDIVNKVEKIYKELELNDRGKEDTKMAEIEFAAVNIGDMWSALYDAIGNKHNGWEYCLTEVYEESNQKFAIIKDRAGKLYRLDFSYTEEGITLADELIEVQVEFVPTENMVKFAEPENVAQYSTFSDDADEDKEDKEDKEEKDEKEEECKCEEADMTAKLAQLEKDLEEKANIIMEKDTAIEAMTAELEELRAFKATVLEKEKAMSVETVMGTVDKYLTDDQKKDFRAEGLACEMAEVDAWANKVRAIAFAAVENANTHKGAKDTWSFSAPLDTAHTQSTNIWDRLKNKNN